MCSKENLGMVKQHSGKSPITCHALLARLNLQY